MRKYKSLGIFGLGAYISGYVVSATFQYAFSGSVPTSDLIQLLSWPIDVVRFWFDAVLNNPPC